MLRLTLLAHLRLQDAEVAVLEFVQRHTDGNTGHHLAGSSVHVDLAFLRRGMPSLAAHMPYRVVVRSHAAVSGQPCGLYMTCALPVTFSQS